MNLTPSHVRQTEAKPVRFMGNVRSALPSLQSIVARGASQILTPLRTPGANWKNSPMTIQRRQVIGGIAALVAAPMLLASDFSDDGFIALTDDGEFMTCPLPQIETIVEVKLRDGSIVRSMFDSHIMEAGDWDFATVTADDEYGDESLADKVVAWRPIAA